MATRIPKRNRQKKKTISPQERSNYLLSLACVMVCAYLCLSFIKASLNHHYLVGLYVDSAVAVIGLVIMIFQMKYQLNIYHQFSNSHKPFIISLLSIVLALIAIILSAHTFDISAIILLIGLFVTKHIAEKEWDSQ